MENHVNKVMVVIVVLSLGIVASAANVVTLLDFNDGPIGTNLNNSDKTRTMVTDTAPIGIAQYHDDMDDGTSNGPAWVSTGTVGDGVGLEFSRTDGSGDRTRISQWLNLTQGNYSEGESFTIMARIKATEAVDGRNYTIFGLLGYDTLSLQGTSTGQLVVKSVVRDGTANGGGEVRWYGNSGDNSNNELFMLDTDTWYNVFLIYNANTGLTVAADDGTTFVSNTNSTVPAGFDSLSHLFSDSTRHWVIGSNTTASGMFEGTMESIRVYDDALSLAEADALTIPEPATLSLLCIGLASLLRRREN